MYICNNISCTTCIHIVYVHMYYYPFVYNNMLHIIISSLHTPRKSELNACTLDAVPDSAYIDTAYNRSLRALCSNVTASIYMYLI